MIPIKSTPASDLGTQHEHPRGYLYNIIHHFQFLPLRTLISHANRIQNKVTVFVIHVMQLDTVICMFPIVIICESLFDWLLSNIF